MVKQCATYDYLDHLPAKVTRDGKRIYKELMEMVSKSDITFVFPKNENDKEHQIDFMLPCFHRVDNDVKLKVIKSRDFESSYHINFTSQENWIFDK